MATATKKKKNKNSVSTAGAILISILAVIMFTGIIVFGYVGINLLTFVNGDASITLSSIKSSLNQTTFLYATDSDGQTVELTRLHGTENRVWIDLEDISETMQKAFVALEDQRFYEHNGVDWIRTIGVFLKNNDQGGSTITQQLIKNITGKNEVTYVRKYHEILTALNIEKAYAAEGYNSKDVILEAYLNTVYLGKGCYGVKTAAETYFGKDVSELNIAECATIAAITKNPYSSDPIGNPEKNRKRMEYCLECMLGEGYITQQEYEEALNYELILTNSEKYVSDGEDEEEEAAETNTDIQSFYVDYVISDVIDDLMETQNCSYSEASGMIYGGGLQIYTAVDLDVQEILEDVYVNKKSFADKKNAQSSMTIMDYEGRVVGIIGQAGKKEGNRVLNRAVDSPRPAGSTIKPLSSYGPAIESDEITYSTAILDKSCTTINGRQWPKNYSGNFGSGSYVTVQNALARSLNTVPARIIKDMIGVSTSYKYLTEKMGFTTLTEEDEDLARLSIGSLSYGMTTLEMTAAYCAYGNGGKYYEPYSYYKVTDSNGDILLDNTSNSGEQIFSAETAEIVRELMKTVVTSPVGTGRGDGVSGFETFAKTGTTDDYKDRWFAGGTPYYFATVWYGYDQPKAINASGNPAGDIFKTVMDRVHKNLADKEFEITSDIVKKYYCSTCGKLASSTTGSSMAGWYKSDNLPGYCAGHASQLTTEETTSASGTTTDDTNNNSNGTINIGGVEVTVTPVVPPEVTGF
ncbi:MAG: transglycosylase domain-containing protein [Clostridia bacterium]|nr:transglycosylase domain-containing protein [Clostridia bacterium]